MRKSKFGTILAFMTVLAFLASGADAGCDYGARAGPGLVWLISSPVILDDSKENGPENDAELDRPDCGSVVKITPEELCGILEDERCVIAYVGNGHCDSYIEGSLLLPSKGFLRQDKTLKSIPDLTQTLGFAGISEDNILVTYSDCLSCGDPTFVSWIVAYLGHGDVRVLDGTRDDWIAAGLPMQKSPCVMTPVEYVPNPIPELLADYDFVVADRPQLVDARIAADFAKGHIEGAVNLEYSRVMEGGRIKDCEGLAEVFVGLDKSLPVVVYSKRGGRASIVWFMLQEVGYDARLYTWQDWLEHQE